MKTERIKVGSKKKRKKSVDLEVKGGVERSLPSGAPFNAVSGSFLVGFVRPSARMLGKVASMWGRWREAEVYPFLALIPENYYKRELRSFLVGGSIYYRSGLFVSLWSNSLVQVRGVMWAFISSTLQQTRSTRLFGAQILSEKPNDQKASLTLYFIFLSHQGVKFNTSIFVLSSAQLCSSVD
jgi:hypothetical protein